MYELKHSTKWSSKLYIIYIAILLIISGNANAQLITIDERNKVYFDEPDQKIIDSTGYLVQNGTPFNYRDYFNRETIDKGSCFEDEVSFGLAAAIIKCDNAQLHTFHFRATLKPNCRHNIFDYITNDGHYTATVYWRSKEVESQIWYGDSELQIDLVLADLDIQGIQTPSVEDLTVRIVKHHLLPGIFWTGKIVYEKDFEIQIVGLGDTYEIVNRGQGIPTKKGDNCVEDPEDGDEDIFSLCCDDAHATYRLEESTGIDTKWTVEGKLSVEIAGPLSEVIGGLSGGIVEPNLVLTGTFSKIWTSSKKDLFRIDVPLKPVGAECEYIGIAGYGWDVTVETYLVDCNDQLGQYQGSWNGYDIDYFTPATCSFTYNCPDPGGLNPNLQYGTQGGKGRSGKCEGYLYLSMPEDDISFYTIEITGPNGFTSSEAINEDLDIGEYNITISAGCCLIYEGTVHICENYEYGPWEENLETGEYCREVTCIDCKGDEMLFTECTSIEDLECEEMAVSKHSNIPCDGENMSLYVSVSGGASPYTYFWNTGAQTSYLLDVDPGSYYVDVIDLNGCVERAEFNLEYTGDITATVSSVQNNTACDNATGSVTVTASGGKLPYLFRLDGTDNTYQDYEEASYESSYTFKNVPTGNYSVAIEDYCGNFSVSYIEVTESAGGKPFDIILTPSNSCTLYHGNGSIDLKVIVGGIIIEDTEGYSFLWSNGTTTEDNENLDGGNYSVTVTNPGGCEKHGSTTVDVYPNDFPITFNTTPSCSGSSNGTAEAIIQGDGEYQFFWSDGQTGTTAINLSPGAFSVNIVNSYGCIKSQNVYIGVEQLDFEVELIRKFNFQNNGGSAQLILKSYQFEDSGEILIVESGQTFSIDYTSYPAQAVIFIPSLYKDEGTFHFVYSEEDGCVFEDEFVIEPCVFPDAGLDFDVVHWGDSYQTCDIDHQNTYEVQIHSAGNNKPYFFRVSMVEADESVASYIQEVPYESGSSLIIEGVPDGIVKFEARSYCDNDVVGTSVIHRNCCSAFDNCEIISEQSFPNANNGDGNHIVHFPFLKIVVEEPCFDPNCFWPLDNFCSKVHVNTNISDSDFMCWDGIVSVQFPDQAVKSFSVNSPDQPGPGTSTGFDWILGENKPWDPPSHGKHTITITYTGTGNSEGVNCTTEYDIIFIDPDGESGSSISLFSNNSHYTTTNPEFTDTYGEATGCTYCGFPEQYFYNTVEHCMDNDVNTRFEFTPDNPNPVSNPCQLKGTLKIIGFGSNGLPIEMNVPIGPGTSKGHLNHGWTVNFGDSDDNITCPDKGICLFDAIDVYGFEMDKLISATYLYEHTCYDNDAPIDCPEVPCDPNETCIDGICVPDCCIEGTCPEQCNEPCMGENYVWDPISEDCVLECCLDNTCPEECNNEPCNGDCPPEQCQNGECLEYLCDDVDIVLGIQYTQDFHKEYYHNLNLGDRIRWIRYPTSTSQGGIGAVAHFRLSGAVDYYYCDYSEPWDDLETQFEIINPNQPLIVDVYAQQCGNGSTGSNRFDVTLQCLDGFTDTGGDQGIMSFENESDSDQNNSQLRKDSNLNIHSCKIYPNPFNDIVYIDYDASSNGSIEIVILDMLGKTILKEFKQVNLGQNTINMTMPSKLPSGIYYLNVSNDQGENETFRLSHIQ